MTGVQTCALPISLMENNGYGISSERLAQYANQIKEIVELGVETGIVIGGGNIFRGLKGEKARSEERRVGKECRSRWSPYH